MDNVELKQCTEAGKPIAGLKVDDYYFDFTFQNKAEHIYLAAKDLTDVYTAGAGLTLTSGEFAVNTEDTAVVDTVVTENSVKLVQSGAVFTAVKAVADDLATHEADAVKHITDAERTTWNAKQDAIADLATIRSNAEAGKAAKDALDNGKYQETIDAAHKLNADLVDDTTAENKFVTTAEKATWNAKQNAITGAATTITDANLTASMILASDSNGKVAATAIPAATAFLTYEVLA